MPKEKSSTCLICGAGGLEQIAGEFKTQIDGPDGRPMTLSVPGLTWRHCKSCGEDLLDENASEAITRAHRAALKLLTAEEIRSLRQRLGKTQAQIGELLGIGEKTYCRWESGTHFQSEAFDRYLRLLQEPEVVDLLNEIKLNKEGAKQSVASKFTYLKVSAYENVSESRKRCSPAAWFALKSA
jgi:putative zinc finger/helix-turn-helix YgiT family protein